MTWFFCSACNKRFKAPFAYYQVTCAFCHEGGNVQPEQGDLGEEIRAREKAGERDQLEKRLARVEQWLGTYRQRLATFRARYVGNDRSVPKGKRDQDYVDRLQELVERVGEYDASAKHLRRELGNFEDRWKMIEDASQQVRRASLNAGSSGKNKLYIGDRQFVVSHTTANPRKTRSRRLRILDSGSWTWGLNTSWVEGGVEARARFKLKLDGSNPRKTFPDDVVSWFKENAIPGQAVPSPTDNARLESEFLDMCREKGRGNLLWYDKDNEERPTWTALEIACLIRRGYRFQFGQTKGGEGKIELIPPAVPDEPLRGAV